MLCLCIHEHHSNGLSVQSKRSGLKCQLLVEMLMHFEKGQMYSGLCFVVLYVGLLNHVNIMDNSCEVYAL